MPLLLKLPLFLLLGLAILALCAFLFTQWEAGRIAQRYPNPGELIDIGGLRLNSVHVPRPDAADLPALLFIHGASGNLRDPMAAFRKPLEGRAEMLFVDRPGHGYSERGDETNLTPAGQADAIARLMDKRGIDSAIIIGHSFGGATAASLALRHPAKVRGLVFLSPATHPWPGGIDWYYDLANTPWIGTLFCNTLTLPIRCLRDILTQPPFRWCCGRRTSATTRAMSPTCWSTSRRCSRATARSRRPPSSFQATATESSMKNCIRSA